MNMMGANKELDEFCKKGLHRMVEGAFRREPYESKSGEIKFVRRCKACQSHRVSEYQKQKRREKKERQI